MTIPQGGDAGDYVGVSVTDAGTGIAPDVLHKIFDPFFTTREIGQGMGMGLSIALWAYRKNFLKLLLGSQLDLPDRVWIDRKSVV